jgi:hypothetical protein
MVAATTPAASKLACDIVRDQLGDLAEVALLLRARLVGRACGRDA